ncbi:MAG TPA: cystathionine beta-lyase, partial [Candidatus Acidoferrum sp.]|nr:cystathionine beta-lyase [Candidatus Acidoferrum sp.]
VYHASTILFPTIEKMEQAQKERLSGVSYGRWGTPTTFAFEEAVAAIEGEGRALALPSGLAAIGATLLSLLKAGDHLLMVDSVYGPARSLCDKTLARFGIDVTYYDPLVGTGIAGLMRPNTRLVYLESPGSLTFEVQDVPAIVAAAHAGGALAIMDNTWATPLLFRALGRGVDIVIYAATKYFVGHSDAMLGAIVVRDLDLYRMLKVAAHGMGYCAAPDDCYLGLRGLRTLGVRLQRHGENGLALARWLQGRPEVARVLHPGLPEHPGHPLWRRDFTGASGLFSVVLKPCAPAAVAALVEGMRLFGMGASWGGYESLLLPVKPETTRTATAWSPGGPTLRIHAGLEAVEDLVADLEDGFRRLAAA